MKYFLLHICFCFTLLAQQTPQFTQFTFNKSGYNPSNSGSNINAGFELISGVRQQWVGFEGAPHTNFFSGNYTIKPTRSYKRWHNIGAYVSQDIAGIFQNTSLYASYTLHLPLFHEYVLSFGLRVGMRQFGFAKSAIDVNDPITKKSSNLITTYPDFVPGLRFKTRKMIYDIALFQFYKNRQTQGDKQIGNKSILTPQIYATVSSKFKLNNNIVFVPALNVHSSFTFIPSAEINLMVYLYKRIGIGSSVRNKSFVSGILQVRMLKNLTIGVAYDYSVNKINAKAPHTYEIMLGLTPLFNELLDVKSKHNVAQCPVFDF